MTSPLLIVPLLSLVLGQAQVPAPSEDPYRTLRLDNGLVLPYPLDNLFRGWVECTGRGHHKALDIGGVGDDYGLGTPIRAMAHAKVVQIGLPAEDPARFGTLLTGEERVDRSGHLLPTSKQVPGYGKVHFFTKNYGQHRAGGTLVLKVLDGPLEGHELRYLHIAAVHPDLEVGDLVEPGQEVALMGGTAVLDAPPHLHLDIEAPDGRSVDVGRILGIGSTRVPCGAGQEVRTAIRARYSKAAKILMSALRKRQEEEVDVAQPVKLCGPYFVDGGFDGGAVRVLRYVVEPVFDADGKPLPFELVVSRLTGKHWTPRLQIEDLHGTPLFTGTLATAKAKRKMTLKSIASGRRGEAHVMVTPKSDEAFAVKVMAWPTSKRALRDARFRFSVERPCPRGE